MLQGRPYRPAGDFVLETAVELPGDPAAHWVPVIPSEVGPYRGTTWRRWIYTSAHAGAFGGHRPALKTVQVVKRQCWWPGMERDIELWVDRCWTCLLFRKRATKHPTGILTARAFFPWCHVMIDFDGAEQPAEHQRQ